MISLTVRIWEWVFSPTASQITMRAQNLFSRWACVAAAGVTGGNHVAKFGQKFEEDGLGQVPVLGQTP